MTEPRPDRAIPAAVVPVALAGVVLLLLAARWVRDPEALEDAPRVTAAQLADPRFAGSTVRLTARVTSVRNLSRDMLVVALYEPGEDLYVQAPVFPRLGCLPVRPLRGETVRLYGSLGAYAGRPQVRPLSAQHVRLDPPLRFGDAVPLHEAATRQGETLLVGPLAAEAVEPFTSRAGRAHFRLRLADPERPAAEPVGGVLFEGNAGHCPLARLRGDEPFFVTAGIEEFGGAPSLNVQRVVVPPPPPPP